MSFQGWNGSAGAPGGTISRKDPHTKASILATCTPTDSGSHMGTPKTLTRQLGGTLISCGNPGPGPKRPAANTGRPVWTVRWKRCYQRTSRNECEGWTACVCVCVMKSGWWPPAEPLWQGDQTGSSSGQKLFFTQSRGL